MECTWSFTTRSGDVTVRGTRGQVEIRSQSGDIHIEDVTTRLDVNSFSGDVTASAIAGDVEISTTSGDMQLDRRARRHRYRTVSGDICLRGVTPRRCAPKRRAATSSSTGSIDAAGRYDFSTHSGDIGLHVQREANAQITVSTWSGSIDSDFPITLKPGEHGIGVAEAQATSPSQIGGGARAHRAPTRSAATSTISSNGHGARDRR